jgi:peptidoglycan lytic transglycosylase
MRPKFNARAAGILTAAAALSMTMIAATRAPASAPSQPDAQLAMTIADRSLGYGQSLVVTGRAPAGLAGHRLVLEFRPRGKDWGPAASTTAASDGRYRFRIRAERSGEARVSVADGTAATTRSAATGTAPSAAAASTVQPVSVAGAFAGRWRAIHVNAGRVAVVRGTLRPGIAGRVVTLERPGRHVLARTRTGAGGRFVAKYRTAGAGSTPLRLRFRGDGANAGAWSRAGVVNAYRQSYASWYEDGGATACGFHAHYGVAHRTLPCGTKVTIRYGGRSVVATVDDRGPFVGGRDWDLNGAVAGALGFGGTGAVWVTR